MSLLVWRKLRGNVELEEAGTFVSVSPVAKLHSCPNTDIPLGTPHAYIPTLTLQATEATKNLFKSLTYSKPNVWQPSAVIFSFGHASDLDVAATTVALDEFKALAIGARRNMPMLFLGPPAATDKNAAVSKYTEEMSRIAREKQYDVLNLFNITLQASSSDGETTALIETMAVVNWLSKLETS